MLKPQRATHATNYVILNEVKDLARFSARNSRQENREWVVMRN
jgi:hypothetical protein